MVVSIVGVMFSIVGDDVWGCLPSGS
jgi:hypothetical protein